jgi:hypothetical protein
MHPEIYSSLFSGNRKVFALLIDPEKYTADTLNSVAGEASRAA